MNDYYQNCFKKNYDKGLEKGYKKAETYGYIGKEARSYALGFAEGYAEASDKHEREEMGRSANLIIDIMTLAKLSPEVVFDSFEESDYHSCLKMEIESRLATPFSERTDITLRPNHYKRCKY